MISAAINFLGFGFHVCFLLLVSDTFHLGILGEQNPLEQNSLSSLCFYAQHTVFSKFEESLQGGVNDGVTCLSYCIKRERARSMTAVLHSFS